MTITSTPPLTPESVPPPDRRRRSAAGTIGTVLVALMVAALLNSSAVLRAARQQEDGWQRTLGVELAEPLDTFARWLNLDAPRHALDELTGKEREASARFGGGLDEEAPTLERAAPPTVTTTTTTAPTTTTTVPFRTPTAAKPLRVLFAGDSLIGNIADGFARLTASDPRIALRKEVQVSTGLARPDVLDWPAHLHGLIEESRPEVIYLMFGGNDDQPLREGDARYDLFTDEWQREYRRRVSIMMDLASKGGRTVVWIAMPTVERERLREAAKIMNAVARAEARERKAVFFYRTNSVLAPSGEYRDEIDGVEVRTADGIHVSHEGSDLLAPKLLELIAALRNLV